MTSLIPNVSFGVSMVLAPLPIVPGGKVDLYFLKVLIGKKQNSFRELHTSRETQRECEFGVKNNRWTIILNLSFNGVALEEVIFGRGWVASDTGYTFRELAIAPADRSKG